MFVNTKGSLGFAPIQHQQSKLAQMGTIVGAHEVVQKADGFYLPRAIGRKGYLTFAATWCGYCTKLAPAMGEASRGSSLQSFVIDGDAQGSKELMSKLNVQGFPTILNLDASGKIMGTYEGDRSVSGLIRNAQQGQQLGGGGGFGGFTLSW
jgi:thiol-disulfide isomerase/thioredoxin